MELSFEKIKGIFEDYGYFAEDELIWQTYLNVDKILNNGQIGQSIHAICLEGPPGSGKTEYATVYSKLLTRLLGENVSLIDYQCDSTTGKSELYEEIRVSAAIAGNPEEVIIAGKIVEAIDEVNKGKKVILFLDEFDKAKEETDTFLLEFLQSGRINTTQRGTIEIDPKYMKNLQVILCKNQQRTELSEALQRRVKILRLAEMKPEIFYKVAQRALPNADADVKNVVSVLYGVLNDNKDNFARISSCSECLMAIKDACTLINANAPAEFVYSAIISNMLKNPNDIETFRELLRKDKNLSEFFKKSCSIRDEISDLSPAEEMRRRMLADFFSKDIARISEDIKRANRMLTEAHTENDYLEEMLEERDKRISDQTLDLESKKQKIAEQQAYIKELLKRMAQTVDGLTVSSQIKAISGNNETDIQNNETKTNGLAQEGEPDNIEEAIQTTPTVLKIGENHKFVQQEGLGGEVQFSKKIFDERFKANESVFAQSSEIWQNFGYISLGKVKDNEYEKKGVLDLEGTEIALVIELLRENPMVKLYKDGIILYEKDGIIIGATRVIEKVTKIGENGEEEQLLVSRYKLFSNQLVIPIYALEPLKNFFGKLEKIGMLNNDGTHLECFIVAEEQKKSITDVGLNKMNLQITPISDNMYYLDYESYHLLENTGKILADQLFTREYDEDMKSELGKIARSRHRQLIQTGRLTPESTEYIRPLVLHESPDDNGGRRSKIIL